MVSAHSVACVIRYFLFVLAPANNPILCVRPSASIILSFDRSTTHIPLTTYDIDPVLFRLHAALTQLTIILPLQILLTIYMTFTKPQTMRQLLPIRTIPKPTTFNTLRMALTATGTYE